MGYTVKKSPFIDVIIKCMVKHYKLCKDTAEIERALDLSCFMTESLLPSFVHFTPKEKSEMYDEILYQIGL